MFASKEITLSVDSGAQAAAKAALGIPGKMGAAAGVGAFTGLVAAGSLQDEKGGKGLEAVLTGAVMGGSAAAIAAVGVAGALAARKGSAAAHAINVTAPELKIETQSIEMSCGHNAMIKINRLTNAISIKGTSVTIEAPTIKLDGAVTVTGPLTVEKDANILGSVEVGKNVKAGKHLISEAGNITAEVGRIRGQNISA